MCLPRSEDSMEKDQSEGMNLGRSDKEMGHYKLHGLACGTRKHEIPAVATRGRQMMGLLPGPHSPVFASVETGPRRFPPWSPKSRNLYLRAGSKPETVTSPRSPLTGTIWGCP